jgi:hypothetical protein
LGLLISFALCFAELVALFLLGVVRPVRGVGHAAMIPVPRAADTRALMIVGFTPMKLDEESPVASRDQARRL